LVDKLAADNSDKFHVDWRMVRLYSHTQPPTNQTYEYYSY